MGEPGPVQDFDGVWDQVGRQVFQFLVDLQGLQLGWRRRGDFTKAREAEHGRLQVLVVDGAELRKRPASLSITHKPRAEHGTQFDVG